MAVSAEQLQDAGVIAIIRSDRDNNDLLSAAEALRRGGVRAMEVTLNTPGALDAIRQIAAKLGDALAVGAGTILSASDVERAIDAGAQFIVTPTFQPDSIAACRLRGVPICCGCLSPAEIVTAHGLGSDFIKVFPATSIGMPAIADIFDEFPEMKFVPTGGVSAGNLASFIEAGCAAVAVGSALVSKDILENNDWAALERNARQFTEALMEARRRCGQTV